jgi:porphobilinogen deaminase
MSWWRGRRAWIDCRRGADRRAAYVNARHIISGTVGGWDSGNVDTRLKLDAGEVDALVWPQRGWKRIGREIAS